MTQEAFDLFISYAHSDAALRRRLDEHLVPLQREGEICAWHDRQIMAGDDWQGQIDDRLESADLILLLVSSSFLASDYCFDVEANRALERHARGEAIVIPIILRPCDWKGSLFSEFQALPRDGKAVTTWRNRDQAWLDIAQGVRAALVELRRGQGSDIAERWGSRQPDDQQSRDADDRSRHLSQQLKSLFKRRKELTLAGDDTTDVEGEILDVRRLLRRGPQLSPGELLGDGRYELIETVGQGGFATVWKAWDGEEHRLVALKVLHGHYSEDRGKRERFFRGARKMAVLAHPHIVGVLETECADDGWYFFVMEFLSGGSFEQAVLTGKLTQEQRLEILLQTGDALEYAHRQGAVHRDVKPSNILLDDAKNAKLTDFDLVRAADTIGLTATRAMMGTVQFAAPEALESAREARPATDVYSLASTAVFALGGGRLPAWYYRAPARAISKLDCADEIQHVLKRATAFEPQQRFASVAEFCEALDRKTDSSDRKTDSSDRKTDSSAPIVTAVRGELGHASEELRGPGDAESLTPARDDRPQQIYKWGRQALDFKIGAALLLVSALAGGLVASAPSLKQLFAPASVSAVDEEPGVEVPPPAPSPRASESTTPDSTSTRPPDVFGIFQEALRSRSMSEEDYLALRHWFGGDLQPGSSDSFRALAAASCRLSGRDWSWHVPLADIKAHRGDWSPAWGPESFSPLYGSYWAAAMSGLLAPEDWWGVAKPWLIAHALAAGPPPHALRLEIAGMDAIISEPIEWVTEQPVFSIHPGDRFLWQTNNIPRWAERSPAHPIVSLAAGRDITIENCDHPSLGFVLDAILDCKAERPQGWGSLIKLGQEAIVHLSELPPLPVGFWHRYRWYVDGSRAVAISRSRSHVRGPVSLAVSQGNTVTYYSASEPRANAWWADTTCRLEETTWVLESAGRRLSVPEPSEVELGILWDRQGARIEVRRDDR